MGEFFNDIVEDTEGRAGWVVLRADGDSTETVLVVRVTEVSFMLDGLSFHGGGPLYDGSLREGTGGAGWEIRGGTWVAGGRGAIDPVR